MNCINSYEAVAFCIWDGGFLPTLSEWGYAAAGGNEQREYPWGATAPGTANQYAIYNCYYAPAATCQGPQHRSGPSSGDPERSPPFSPLFSGEAGRGIVGDGESSIRGARLRGA